MLDGTDLERSLLDLPRGKVVDVIVARDGREQTLQLTVGVGKADWNTRCRDLAAIGRSCFRQLLSKRRKRPGVPEMLCRRQNKV